MINILTNEPVGLYFEGLSFLLSEIFDNNSHDAITITNNMTTENMVKADIIIVSLCRGEEYTCKKAFFKKSGSLIIGLIGDNESKSIPLPPCNQRMILISRRESIPSFKKQIIQAWERTTLKQQKDEINPCSDCKPKVLTPRLNSIITGMLNGKSISVIASELNICEKTVHSHKYTLMKKFFLRNDYDLQIFIRRLGNQEKLYFGWSVGSE